MHSYSESSSSDESCNDTTNEFNYNNQQQNYFRDENLLASLGTTKNGNLASISDNHMTTLSLQFSDQNITINNNDLDNSGNGDNEDNSENDYIDDASVPRISRTVFKCNCSPKSSTSSQDELCLVSSGSVKYYFDKTISKISNRQDGYSLIYSYASFVNNLFENNDPPRIVSSKCNRELIINLFNNILTQTNSDLLKTKVSCFIKLRKIMDTYLRLLDAKLELDFNKIDKNLAGLEVYELIAEFCNNTKIQESNCIYEQLAFECPRVNLDLTIEISPNLTPNKRNGKKTTTGVIDTDESGIATMVSDLSGDDNTCYEFNNYLHLNAGKIIQSASEDDEDDDCDIDAIKEFDFSKLNTKRKVEVSKEEDESEEDDFHNRCLESCQNDTELIVSQVRQELEWILNKMTNFDIKIAWIDECNRQTISSSQQTIDSDTGIVKLCRKVGVPSEVRAKLWLSFVDKFIGDDKYDVSMIITGFVYNSI